MKALCKIFVPLLASALLAGCGGGGGDDGHAIFTPDSIIISMQSGTQDLPLNTTGLLPNPGGPFTTEVSITLRYKSSGQLVNNIDSVNVDISPVKVATFSILDDPSTTDVNEIQLRLGQGPVNVVAGKATIFVTSSSTAGSAVVTASAPALSNPNGGTTAVKSATMTFTVANTGAALPAAINLSSETNTVYLPGSGGASTSLLTAFVTDSGHQSVPDPVSGNSASNNVEFKVIGGSTNGSLSGTSAGGGTVSGDVINVRTTKGIANALFHAGTTQGRITVQATADAADNNVDNGIQAPVTAIVVAVVSDGKAFSITLTSPTANAIFINAVTEGVEAPTDGSGGVQIPADPDGTYSLTVSALVTDRQGNPVLPGTLVSFGAIDAPLTGFPAQGAGNFPLSGIHGDPQEGGTLFTAPNGHFTVVSGAGPQYSAGPGDTLLVYGKLVPGNSDLESARTVAGINSASSLNVTSAFNRNDTSGSSVDFGAVLPWIIGRGDNAVINASATTDAHGAASVQLTYPINQLGKHVAIFAQVDAATAADAAKKISDIADLRFAGVAPAQITASPVPIRGNGTVYETVCVYDALGAPLAGLPVAFGFHNLEAGSGSIDGIAGSGEFASYTNGGGCAVGEVKTLGISGSGGSGSSSPGVIFNAAGATVDVPIVAGGQLMLLASPSSLSGLGGKVTLTLVDGSGNPVPGIQIGGSCEAGSGASVGLSKPPGVTNASGQTTATITASGLNGYNESSQGSCTFNTAGSEPTVTVTLVGQDLCTVFSPVPTQCNQTGNSTVNMSIVRPVAATNTAAIGISSNPAGISCSMGASDNGITCTPGSFTGGTTVTITATVISGAPIKASWSGDCTPTSAGALSATVQVNSSGSQSCTLSVNDP
ncbi:MAG: hypothetical protein L0H70_02600 [Xanthomonadales bacterium]|nr:hypothetical protein [Xanthomonadales bacterium]